MNTRKFISTALATVVTASVLMTGCGAVDKDATLITINEGEATVSLGYGNFVARYQQSMYDQYLMAYYGESMWTSDLNGTGSTFQEDVKSDVLDTITEQYVCNLHASDYGCALTDDEVKACEEAAKKFIEANDAETIKALGADEAIVTQYLTNRTLATKVVSEIKKSANITVSDDECWQRSFSYVFFSTAATTDSDGNSVELTETEIAALAGQAAEVAEAEDFEAKSEELEKSIATYSYTKGEEEDSSFDMAVISAAESLKEGQVSKVIEVEGTGYYVLRLDSEHDLEASETKRESITSTKEDEFLDELIETWKSEATIVTDEKAWSKVKFDSLFTAKAAEEEAEVAE